MKPICLPCPEPKKPDLMEYIRGKKVTQTVSKECLIPLLKQMTSNKYCDIPPKGCD